MTRDFFHTDTPQDSVHDDYTAEAAFDSADISSSDASDNSGAYSHSVSGFAAPMSYAGGREFIGSENVLRDVINDEQYLSLYKLGVLNEKVLRDFRIRKTFRELRAQHLSAHQAIDRLTQMYPYLQFDTLRKIVYQINDKS